MSCFAELPRRRANEDDTRRVSDGLGRVAQCALVGATEQEGAGEVDGEGVLPLAEFHVRQGRVVGGPDAVVDD